MSTHTQLRSLAASLVDDVDALVKQLEDDDQVLGELSLRGEQQKAKAQEFSTRAAEHLAKSDAHALQVADFKAQLKYADLVCRTEKGHHASFKYKETVANKNAREVASRISTRKEMLLRKEIDKRVNAIGKKVVRNIGHRRTGGDFALIEDDGLLPGNYPNPNSLINKPAQDNGPQE